MDRIHYAGDSILTGTEIAHALLDYAQALAEVGASATVEIPTISADGAPGRSEVLVGPASQLIASAEDSPHPELTDADLVARLRAEAARLRSFGITSPQAVVSQAPADGPVATWPITDEGTPGDWSEYGV